MIKGIFFENLFSTLKFSVVVLLMLILTKPIVKRYTAGFRYYSWLAVMIIFLIPFGTLGIGYTINATPAAGIGQEAIVKVREWYYDKVPKHTVTEVLNTEEGGEGTETTKYKVPVDTGLWLGIVWILGAASIFIFHMRKYFFVKKALRRLSSPASNEKVLAIFEEEKKRLGIEYDLPLRISEVADTPVLAGILKPFVILPKIKYSAEELHLIFRHELIHFKRKDILYRLIMLVFMSINWFNPLAYVVAEAVEIDGETACDEMVLEGCGYETRLFYGEMLIKFLRAQNKIGSYMTTAFFGGKRGMKKRLTLIASKKVRRKGTVAMALITAITILMSVSAAAMNNEYLGEIFKGDTSYLADFVNTEKKSVEDKNYRLTLEQYLVSEKQAMIIFSVELISDKALTEFNSEDENGNPLFWDLDTISFGPVRKSAASVGGFGWRQLGDGKLDTERKKYFVLESSDIENDEAEDFYISFNKISGSPKITFPMELNLKTVSLDLDGVLVEYDPISIRITRTMKSDDTNPCGVDWLWFRMKDGEIKTYNQLYSVSSGTSSKPDKDGNTSYVINSLAKNVIKPDAIKSIIVDGTEYPTDDITKKEKAEIDDKLKPFDIKPYNDGTLRLPLREFCEKLGAEIEWNQEEFSAIVNYRGKTYVFTPNSTKVKINDEIVDFYDEYNNNLTSVNEYGRIVVTSNIAEYMDIGCYGLNVYTADGTVGKDAILHIVP